MEDCKNMLLEKLLMELSSYNIPMQELDLKISKILYNFTITPREESLVPYSESKNELYLKRFILSKAVAGCTERTINLYDQEIRRTLSSINLNVDEITANDIKNYLAQQMIRGVSKSTVDNRRRYLNSFFNYLHREELIEKNPMSKVDKIRYHKEKESALTDIEVEKLRAACKNAFETAAVEFLLSTGCRATEVVSVKIEDIDGDTINVLGKGEKWRKVYLNAKCQVSLSKYLSERKDKNPYLFPAGMQAINCPEIRSSKGNWYKNPNLINADKHFNKESLNSMLKKIAKRAGVDGVHTHRFRRTCATAALKRGMPIELVSKMLGHTNLQTTQIYLDLTEDDMKAAHEKFVY